MVTYGKACFVPPWTSANKRIGKLGLTSYQPDSILRTAAYTRAMWNHFLPLTRRSLLLFLWCPALEGTMFFRTKSSGPRTYLQVVENRWEGGRSRQRVVATLGRLDQLQQNGQLDALLVSGARLARSVLLLSEHAQGRLPTIAIRYIGLDLVFQRLWQLTGCQHVIQQLLKGRRFEFPIERAVFLTVLHRLFDPGSDRAADKWKEGYQIDGCEDLQLHHLYRAMGWLGDELPRKEQADKTPFAPRCNKDLIAEALFARRRDLFTQLQLVFFDTTSIYFEGQRGETIGQRGYSQDHRPDLKQMIVGAVLDAEGRPICCELWPGNTVDVTTLIPVVDRLRSRFGVTKVCIVADRGMISQETIEELEKQERGWQYILGARMRSQNDVKDEVLARAGRYWLVHPQRTTSADPAPSKVKEVRVEGRRYIVCLNDDEACKDAADRQAIVASLREKLRTGEKSLVGNKGYRRTSALRARITSRSTRRRSRKRLVTMASGCFGPTWIWIRPRWRCSTSGSGWWRPSSARPSSCCRPGRSITSATRRSGATSSARSWRWCCARSLRFGWLRTVTTSSGRT
jgi:hypothetical protein